MSVSALEQAYRATSYEVDVPTHGRARLAIRIGERNAALDELLAAHDVDAWAYVTAFNPGSAPLTDEENARRHEALVQHAASVTALVFTGAGIADDGRWPSETSLLLLGVGRSAAVEIGRRFGQLAVVCGERGSEPVLCWCV